MFFLPLLDAKHLTELPEPAPFQQIIQYQVVAEVKTVQFLGKPAEYFGRFLFVAFEFFFQLNKYAAFHGLLVCQLDEVGISGEHFQGLVVRFLNACNLSDKFGTCNGERTKYQAEPTHG